MSAFIQSNGSPTTPKTDTVVAVDITDSEVVVDKFSAVRVPLSRPQFLAVVISLALGVLLAALDQTIVSAALKSIVADLGREDLLSWIGSAYMLSSCAFCPLYGKLADIFGRKWTFVTALVIFEVGSLMCGIATSMPFLIVGRAIAGLGGGGIMSLVFIILSDIVSIQDRGKYQGLIGGTYTFASVLGPLVGGSFVDYATWRWCFFINLPIGAITVACVIFMLKFPKTEGSMTEKLKRIDFLGALVLIFGIIALLTPLQLGGNTWSWNAAPTIASLAVSAVLIPVFVWIEGWVAEPLIPYSLFKNRSVPALLVITFCLGASMFTAIYYTALFFQIAQGYSATGAGIQSTPLIFGAVLVSIGSGLFVSKYGKYKLFFFLGPLFMASGIISMSFLNQTSSMPEKIAFLFIFGMGCGSQTQMAILALQSSVEYPQIAIVTSVGRTFQQLGGSVGVAVIGNILNTVLAGKISSDTQQAVAQIAGEDPRVSVGQPLQVIQFLQDMNASSGVLVELVDDFVGAYRIAYLSILPFAAVIVVAAVFVKQYEVKGKGPAVAKAPVVPPLETAESTRQVAK
ncbi:hypothetical protein HDU98_001050 [Podochytrium sp. JEL0797]|nr:hypothetical protein HDU98_001050 [Podochytrium sp. JEL0797]